MRTLVLFALTVAGVAAVADDASAIGRRKKSKSSCQPACQPVVHASPCGGCSSGYGGYASGLGAYSTGFSGYAAPAGCSSCAPAHASGVWTGGSFAAGTAVMGQGCDQAAFAPSYQYSGFAPMGSQSAYTPMAVPVHGQGAFVQPAGGFVPAQQSGTFDGAAGGLRGQSDQGPRTESKSGADTGAGNRDRNDQ